MPSRACDQMEHSNELLQHLRARGRADRRALILWRRREGGSYEPAFGSDPAVPAAKPQGGIPTLKMPTAKGWSAGTDAGGRARTQGQRVRDRSQASALDPRAAQRRRAGRRGADPARSRSSRSSTTPCVSTMQRAAAVGASPNRITLLRDADGDGVAEIREVFLDRLNQPFGMALLGDTFYVGNTDGVMAFPYTAGASRITAPGRQADDVQARRALDPQPAAEPRRARSSTSASARSPISPTRAWRPRRAGPRSTRSTSRAARSRIFASGLRNPGRPGLGAAHRRALDGGQRARRARRRDAARLPDLGAGRRLLRLALLLLGPDGRRPRAAGSGDWSPRPSRRTTRWAGTRRRWACAGCRPARCPAFRDGMAIGQHGSWNRSKLSGYKVVFVPFDGRPPAGPPRDILTGFLAPDETDVLRAAGGRDDRPRRLACWWRTMWAT